MRELTDEARLRRFMSEIGRRVREPLNVYLVGGSTAVLLGWRDTTVDPGSSRSSIAFPR